MAKRAAKKKAGKRATKKAAKRGGAKNAPAGGGPFKVSTGAGASPLDIGRAVVQSLNAGSPDAPLWDRYWSDRVESVEGMGMNMGWRGRTGMEGKAAAWLEKNKVLGCSAGGPYVGSTGFAVTMSMDVEDKATGQRRHMEEIGVYTVKNGKVVREEFMYAAP